MSTVANWRWLRAVINRLKADGARGFEGLIAALFSAETRESFYLARRGDQPVGDAYSVAAATALQTKRYRTAKVSENNVEGEIDRALRDAPALDLFVVAVTRTDAQLRARLAQKAQETGLDIVLLELSDELSALGALCVAHWEVTKTFLPRQNAAANAWALAQASAPETLAALEGVRGELRGRATRDLISRLTGQQLTRRFGGEPARNRTHNSVDLNRLVPRPRLLEQLETWWTSPEALPMAVLQGEEGTGKTWVAAAFAGQSLPRLGTAPVVFWLDSLSWGQSQTVAALADAALAGLFLPTDKRVERLKRKLFHHWAEPVLFVLDGANERGAWSAAEHLLADFAQHEDAMRPKLRLLFTSRNPAGRIGLRRNFWAGSRIVPVGPFDDAEFRAALAQQAPDLTPEDFTCRVSDYARLPRYFQLCVRLREQLNGLRLLNKPLLLWADLRDKIEHGDPQLLDVGREMQSHAEGVLAALARATGWPQNGHATLTTTELEQRLPNFRRVRDDLIEQRIAVDGDFDETILSADHVIVGWALVLQRAAKRCAPQGFDAITDRLEQLLEPAAANDDKVRAVHLASLLTFLDGTSDEAAAADAHHRLDRAALLAWWAAHHNATVSVEQMGFFVVRDLVAYGAAVEMLFRRHLPGNLETALIAPLAQAWREQKGDIVGLQSLLERWLRLIHPGDASGSKDHCDAPPARFPAAASQAQLRLSYAAISVISFRPEPELLPALADCYWSDDFCYHNHRPGDDSLRLPVKSPIEPLGTLLRWIYTETVLINMKALAERLPEGKELSSLQWFARLLRMAKLPPALGDAKDYVCWEENPPEGQANLALLRDYLNKEEACNREPVGLGKFEWLAVRRDLPELNAAEVQALQEDVRSRIQNTTGFHFAQDGWERNRFDDLLPWVARYAPTDFAAAVRALWKATLGSADALPGLMHLDESLPAADSGGELIDLLLEKGSTLLAQERLDFFIVPLTELAMLHGTLNQVVAWLRSIQDRTLSRNGGTALALLPLPTVFSGLAPSGLTEAVRNEFEKVWHELPTVASQKQKSLLRARAQHWLQAYAYVVEADAATMKWALRLADEVGEDDAFRFPLFCIVARSKDPALFRRALLHPAFREYYTGHNSYRWSPQFSKEQWAEFSYEELAAGTSLTVCGRLLWEGGRDADLCRWGRKLAAQALEAVQMSPAVRDSGMTHLAVNVDENANLRGFRFRLPASGGESWHATSSPAWGIDRRTVRPTLTQEDVDRATNQFHADLEVWSADPHREFMGFNAVGPLWRWSELEPDQFTAFAETFLGRLQQKEEAGEFVEFTFFARTVAAALLRINPERALPHVEPTSEGMRVRVFTFGGALSWARRELWKAELNGSAAVEDCRRHNLQNADSDEELLWHALAAHAGSNAEYLGKFAQERLEAPLARERALGVTLLAFQGDRPTCARLERLIHDDPSFWVREHAQWAHEVCATELDCRNRYRALLRAGTLEEMAVGLAEIRLAASPMAYAWRHQIEREENWNPEARIRTFLELFWYHWGNTTSRQENIQLCGRKLKKFCRGEPQKEGVTDRQSPWWQL